MRRAASHLVALFLAVVFCVESRAFADASEAAQENQTNPPPTEHKPAPPISPTITPEPEKPKAPFFAFTGRITKNRVRLRIQPNLDSPILKELNRDDLLVVVGESDDFYAIKAPEALKAFIFRTFVLDNVVEGSRVNVRLEPTLDSPIIAQLNQGDRVQGTISPLNSKWYEIAPPESTRFYVAKEFVQNIGDPSTMAKILKRREDVEKLWNAAYSASQSEIQKPFDQMNVAEVFNTINKITGEYTDFPEHVEKAKALQASLQDMYTKKKLTYLEAQNQKYVAQEKTRQQKKDDQVAIVVIPPPEHPSNQPGNAAPLTPYTVPNNTVQNATPSEPAAPTDKMAQWDEAEQTAYSKWAASRKDATQDEFYKQETARATTLTGILEGYNKTIKNRPGDFLLLDSSTNMPMAYLYSTRVNLQDKLGQKVTLKAVSRPNNNFAFPAYYVLTVEK